MKNEMLFILLLLLSLSCSKKEEHNKVVPNKDKTFVFFNPITLGASGVDSNLNINASFSECGEWGGNYENLKIFSKKGNYKDHFLKYRKTNVDCDKRDSNGRNIETVV
ncbi:hypothetical protein [Flavobacterium fluviatile]|uniref:hypothetical protein n=1 Tax=Flavobacterium fluviatile TaxID=1862387 RepID=UPI0013D8CF3B|nr:hypothetical protein [Flavobacterium fluviatile]